MVWKFFGLLSYTALENMLNINVIFITQPKGVHKHFEEVAEHVSAEEYFYTTFKTWSW